MNRRTLKSLYVNFVNAISFSAELQKLQRELNSKIDMPSAIDPGPRSHPLGVSRWYKKRQISIAEAYLMVIRDLESKHSKSRLQALRMLIDSSVHSKTLDMPLNTARVQMALIKQAIKSRGDSRWQLELLQDFSISAHGQHQVIRRLLDELNLVELPETGARLKSLDAGWDGHVHDRSTFGRKNPTQLLIDAFIKGISTLTVAYTSAGSVASMAEAVDAGRIVGIRVTVGLEFSAYVLGARCHFMAVLPHLKSGKEVYRWFKEHSGGLAELFDGLEKNQGRRAESVRTLLKHFNEHTLAVLNDGFPKGDLYRMPKLRLKELKSLSPESSINRLQLGEFMHSRYKRILFNRVMFLKARYLEAERQARLKLLPAEEFDATRRRYSETRREYLGLNSERLLAAYFSNPELGDYHTVFSDLRRLKSILAKAGCAVRLLYPLEHGLENAKKLLSTNRGIIDQVEIYNVQDSAGRDPDKLLELGRFVGGLNAEKGRTRCVPVCGSDSTGRNPSLPGMGFIRKDRLVGKYRQRYAKRHTALPAVLSAMIGTAGDAAGTGASAAAPVILCMGKTAERSGARVGDEGDAGQASIPLSRAWRYLNPGVANVLLALIGFLVARRFIGPAYALLWLFITGFRNSIADLIAGRGARIHAWKLKSIDFGNVARSLFWTGFSVPILGFVKARFDLVWPGPTDGLLFNAAKFFTISFANGLYLATHNTLRGFDRRVVRANFFRSVLAWPLATLAAPLGNLLGIPSIVQAKIWSDVVAGFIEGGSKYIKVLKLRRRDLEEILPRVVTGEKDERYTALLDLLYLFREEPRTASSLTTILAPGYLPWLKADSDTQSYTFEDFYGSVMDHRLDRGLVDFILARYVPDISAELVNLASVTLPEFRAWLANHAGRFRQVRPAETVDEGKGRARSSTKAPSGSVRAGYLSPR